jgi:pyridoxal phosphate-dependent aminotransferase EpsN
MKKFRIWLSPPFLSGKEYEYIQNAIHSGWITTLGDSLEQFEIELSKLLHYKKVCCLNSGTSAIHLALKLLNIQERDEIICPSLTFIATANPILYEKACPIFVDSEPETWNLSPEWLEIAIRDRIKKGKKPKAIMIVHLYGNSAKLSEIQKIAEHYEIPIIEDNAEAFGASYQQKPLGTFGKFGILSFNGNKIITTSAGGALICEPEFYQKAKYLAQQAKSPLPYYHHEEIGYNYSMSNLLAALGLAQLSNLEQRIHAKRSIFFRYHQEIIQPFQLEFPKELPNSFSTRWLTTFLLPPNKNPQELTEVLKNHQIEARRIWKPLHLQPIMQHFPFYGEHLCTHLFEKGICLPSGIGLTPAEQSEIIDIIKSFLFS